MSSLLSGRFCSAGKGMDVQITDSKVQATGGFATNLPLSLSDKSGKGERIYRKKLDSPMHYPFVCPRNKKRPT